MLTSVPPGGEGPEQANNGTLEMVLGLMSQNPSLREQLQRHFAQSSSTATFADVSERLNAGANPFKDGPIFFF